MLCLFLFYRSIEKFGTHIVVGVTMGGKNVVYMKQMCNSNHEPDEVQMLLKQVADKKFSVDPVESISPTAVYSANLGVKKECCLSHCILSQLLQNMSCFFFGSAGGESYPMGV